MTVSSDAHDYDRFDELAEEFAQRYRRGERPSLEEYVDRLPEMADEIREMFPALIEVEQVEGAARDDAFRQPHPAVARLNELGDYRIVREVGHGGMGIVYEAEQVSLGRRVALKVLPRHVASDVKALERFRREAKAAARLHHTNIVPVFEVGQQAEVAFYTMQFIQGQGLDQVIEELVRLRSPDGKSLGKNDDHAGSARPVRLPVTFPGAAMPTDAPPIRKLGHMAESLLSGRLGTEGMKSSTGDANAVTEAAGTELLERGANPDPPARDPGQYPSAASPASGVSSSAVLPGGTAVSMVESSAPRRPFFRSVAQIGRQTAQGLAYAHSRGIVHRDIKPSNLLLDTAGVVWITDFGLAKAEEDGLTASGDILGTFRYMAPERFRGEGDARADIYALGLTLYELLTFRPAFNTSDRLKLIERIKNEEPARPRSLDVRIPRDLETIVLKAIEKHPLARYESAEAMAEDLRRFLDDEPIKARRASAAERYARWARHHPAIAVLGAVLTAVLVLTTLTSLFVADRMAHLAQNEQKSRAIAQAETYRAMLNEVKALRVGHQPGWREEALGDLARIAAMSTPRRDLPELRTEAAATLGTPDIRVAAKVELPADDLGSFTFSPDGRKLLTAGRRTGLEFWDVHGKRHRSSVEGLTVSDTVFDKALYLPDGHGLVVATRDRGVVFTDSRGVSTTRGPLTQGRSQPIKLAVSASGHRIAVAWTDGAGITVYDMASGTLIARFKNSPFALSPDGRWLACQENADIVLLPIASSEPRIVLGRHAGASALAFSPDGAMLAAAFVDHTTVLWDVAKREQFGTLRGHRERVFDVAFSPDGAWIATGSLDYTVRIWETRTAQSVATLSGSAPALRVQWSPAGDYLATSTNSSREVLLYTIMGRRGVQQWLTGHRVELRCVAAHPYLERITSSGYTELMSWDLSVSPPSPIAIGPNPGAVTSLAYSADGALLATASWLGSNPREVVIRDANTGKVRGRVTGPEIVFALAFDPTGKRLACGDQSGNVVVWDLATNQPVQRFVTGATVWSIIFLESGRSLVTHGNDEVLSFNLDSGQLERKVDLAGGGIRTLAADRPRSRLVVGFQNGAIGSLSLPDLTLGARLEGAHAGSVDCMAMSPDGRLLATGGADHRVVLRDAISLEPLLDFPLWAGYLRDLTFDFQGRRLVVVGTDCDIDLWDLVALYDGLKALGLAWDRPAPGVVSESGAVPEGDHLRPGVPVIRRPGPTKPAALERAP